jgi:hypothetical protein
VEEDCGEGQGLRAVEPREEEEEEEEERQLRRSCGADKTCEFLRIVAKTSDLFVEREIKIQFCEIRKDCK